MAETWWQSKWNYGNKQREKILIQFIIQIRSVEQENNPCKSFLMTTPSVPLWVFPLKRMTVLVWDTWCSRVREKCGFRKSYCKWELCTLWLQYAFSESVPDGSCECPCIPTLSVSSVTAVKKKTFSLFCSSIIVTCMLQCFAGWLAEIHVPSWSCSM
jgi:hypothetical protein